MKRTRRSKFDTHPLAGVDEAGRGPLAGPVVVAAVILDPARRIKGLADSKVLCERRRDELANVIRERALASAVVVIDVDDIDRLNIFHATMLGMSRALAALSIAPLLALIDGNHLPKSLCCAAQAIVDGDAREPSISAASILAKTARDALMRDLDRAHPHYGFAQHKGYSTAQHIAALAAHGPCPQHRRSFAPVRASLARQDVFAFACESPPFIAGNAVAVSDCRGSIGDTVALSTPSRLAGARPRG